MEKPIIVECPECKREARVFKKQEVFVCKDSDQCGFQCDMTQILGFLRCIDDQWHMTNTERI